MSKNREYTEKIKVVTDDIISMESTIKDFENKDDVVSENIVTTLDCKIKAINGKNIFVDFNGYGLIFETKNKFNKNDIISVKYTGEIGKPDFKAWVE